MKTQSHHHPTPTPTHTFDEEVAMEAAQIREAQELEGEAYRENPAYTPVMDEEEREERRLAMEEFSSRSIFRFLLEMLAQEYSVAGIVAAGIPEWMVQRAARTALGALDFAIVMKADREYEPNRTLKGKRRLTKSPRRSRRPTRRSNSPR